MRANPRTRWHPLPPGWAMAFFLGLAHAQEEAAPLDPAPPTVAAAPAIAPPEARPRPGVRFHRAPAPLSPDAITGNWNAFLGPDGTNVSAETHLRKEWDEAGPPLVWELESGSGYAAPSIQGERLVFFHRIGDEEVVECLRAETGERFWELRSPTDYRDSYGYGNGPRCTPLIDDEHVYTYGVQGRLQCVKLATGQLLWKRNLSEEFDVPQDFFGVVSTPVVYGDLLIVHLGAPGGPCVIALNKATGKVEWRSGTSWRAGYATPVIARAHGVDKCFVFAGGKSRPPSGGLLCLDPATGAIDFEFPWRSETYESVNAAQPLAIGNRVFVSATYETGGALLDLQAGGGYELAWTSEVLSTHFNSPIHKDGYLYGFDGRNEPDASLVCQEVESGKEMWRVVLEWEDTFELYDQLKPRTMSVYRGSLLAADGDYLCLGERGHLLWLELTPEGYRELDRAWLFAAHESWTPLVLSRGLLYVRQNERDFINKGPRRLLCYDLRRPAD